MVDVEETPIIDPKTGTVVAPQEPTSSAGVTYNKEDVIPEAAQLFQPESIAPSVSKSTLDQQQSEQPKPSRKSSFHFGTIVFIVLLFCLGVWLSMQLRSFFAPVSTEEVAIPTTSLSPFATTAPNPTKPPISVDTAWVTYQVVNGVSYKLPGTVDAPTCDGGSCPSKGTNLPNGTRFTVAPRGKGQLLPDFRGAILTDAGGQEFSMKQTTVSGVNVYEYVGNFTGRTGGGYTFTAMRGVLVPVSDTLAIEFNHFAPLGVATDFAKDEILFDKIIGTFTSSIPSPTVNITFPTNTPTATSSGF